VATTVDSPQRAGSAVEERKAPDLGSLLLRYAVPAAIGAKLANPGRQVVSIVGDGAFLMTGLDIVTASTLGLGIAWFVFDDGELSQISQGQEIPYNRKSCTVLGNIRLSGIAEAVGASFIR